MMGPRDYGTTRLRDYGTTRPRLPAAPCLPAGTAQAGDYGTTVKAEV